MRKLGLAAVAAMMVSGAAMADNFGASANYGLGGLGVDLGYAIMPDFVNLRAGLNGGLNSTGTITPDVTPYNYDLTTGYKTLGLDWHPFGGSFRLSAGYAWSDIKLDLNTTGTYTYGSQTVTGTAAAQIKYANAPYLSLGWGNHAPTKGGLFFNTELGAMLTGQPDVTLSESTGTVTQANIDAERNKVRSDAMGFFPIAKLGLGYTF
jgi:hypothetical protein